MKSYIEIRPKRSIKSVRESIDVRFVSHVIKWDLPHSIVQENADASGLRFWQERDGASSRDIRATPLRPNPPTGSSSMWWTEDLCKPRQPTSTSQKCLPEWKYGKPSTTVLTINLFGKSETSCFLFVYCTLYVLSRETVRLGCVVSGLELLQNYIFSKCLCNSISDVNWTNRK